jgi:TorA maturation chaperone TorD
MTRDRAAEVRRAGGAAHHSKTGAEAGVERDDIDLARSEQYALLAALLLRPPNGTFLERLAGLEGSATPLGQAQAALGEAAATASGPAVEREYFELFIGVGRGELLPYASYYLTGFLNERPLVRLRQDLARLGLERSDGHTDPEDHLGTVCEVMSGFTSGSFAASRAEERDFFTRHLAPWAERFFADLEQAEDARFYKAVGTMGRIFMQLEQEGFAMEQLESA